MATILINVINQNAEQALLSAVEQHDKHHALCGALYFGCSKLERKPQEEEILPIVRPLLQDKDAVIYFFHDGDLVVTWNGVQKLVLNDLCKKLYSYFHLTGSEALHSYYDFDAHGEDLRSLCKHKIEVLSAHGATTLLSFTQTVSTHPFKLAFTNRQLEHIKKFGRERHKLKMPTLLIIEDQEFSRKLLEGLLNRVYVTHSASNAEQAVALYAEHVPCITFLDIELPDISGHELAAFLKQHDPDGYIVMVTANHYAEDVTRAKSNGTKGFVGKPYSKQKILECIEKYNRERKLKP